MEEGIHEVLDGVEPCGGRILRLWGLGLDSWRVEVGLRVDLSQEDLGFTLLDPEDFGAEEGVMEGHIFTPQVLGDFIGLSPKLEGGVLFGLSGHRSREGGLEEVVLLGPADLVGLLLPDGEGGPAREAMMGPQVVKLLDPGPQPEVEVVESLDLLPVDPLEEEASKGAPESFDLSLARPVVGPGEFQLDAELRAGEPGVGAGETSVVVQKESRREAPAADGFQKDQEEFFLGLVEAGPCVENHPALVVQEGEDLHPDLAARGGIEELWAVAGVPLPQIPAIGGDKA